MEQRPEFKHDQQFAVNRVMVWAEYLLFLVALIAPHRQDRQASAAKRSRNEQWMHSGMESHE